MIEIEWCKQHNAYFKGCVYCEYDKVTESFSKALSSNIQTNMNLTHANEEISKLKAEKGLMLEKRSRTKEWSEHSAACFKAEIAKLRAEKTAECDCCGYVNGSGKLSEYRKLLQIAALQAQDNG
jgi:hypothetical protein